MASVNVGESGSGRRKNLDAEVNLVPFIDLLSMCISFLLLTAVWISVGAVQIKQSHGTEAAVQTKDQFEVSVRFETASKIFVELKKGKAIAKRQLDAPTNDALLK